MFLLFGRFFVSTVNHKDKFIRRLTNNKITISIRQKTRTDLIGKIRFKEGYLDLYKFRFLNEDIRNSYMPHSEYIDLSLRADNVKVLDYCRDRRYFYERCADLCGREVLILENASKDDIEAFIRRNPKFVGKTNNDSGAEGFSVYTAADFDSYDSIAAAIAEKKQEFLEGFIYQHSAVSEINPRSVNTLRIHTVNNGKEIRTFFKPKLRIGRSCSDIDILSFFGSLRAIVEDDGTLTMPCYLAPDQYIVKCTHHPDTGKAFSQVKIPYIGECIELCIEGASRFPEVPYMAWDAAISENGPVLVEANAISGCFDTYQMINILYNGKGLRKELLEMFKFAGVDAENDENKS